MGVLYIEWLSHVNEALFEVIVKSTILMFAAVLLYKSLWWHSAAVRQLGVRTEFAADASPCGGRCSTGYGQLATTQKFANLQALGHSQ